MCKEYTKDHLTSQGHSHVDVLSPSLDPMWCLALEQCHQNTEQKNEISIRWKQDKIVLWFWSIILIVHMVCKLIYGSCIAANCSGCSPRHIMTIQTYSFRSENDVQPATYCLWPRLQLAATEAEGKGLVILFYALINSMSFHIHVSSTSYFAHVSSFHSIKLLPFGCYPLDHFI